MVCFVFTICSKKFFVFDIDGRCRLKFLGVYVGLNVNMLFAEFCRRNIIDGLYVI